MANTWNCSFTTSKRFLPINQRPDFTCGLCAIRPASSAWRTPTATIRDYQRGYHQLERYLDVLAEEVQRALGDVLAFVQHIRTRIDTYAIFGRRMLSYLQEEEKRRPELAPFLRTLPAVTPVTRDVFDGATAEPKGAPPEAPAAAAPPAAERVTQIVHTHVPEARRHGPESLAVLFLAGGGIEGFAQVIDIAHGGRRYKVKLPLVGAFQVQNAVLAAGLAIATGAEPARTFVALEHLTGAKGRLELVGNRNGAPIFIDYAHKPDALKKALGSLRPYAKGKLTVVFGAGGDRDSGKRPIMGRVAVEGADKVIVTDDNPRSESPAAIRAAILADAPGAAEIGDRAEAIRKAIADLNSGDVLLIAGKGHETGQIVGDRVLPFSDHDAVVAALQGRVA